MSTAPIILFVYNRLEHTKRTISALQNNYLAADSDLYIYADAAKDASAAYSVEQLRNFLATVSGFRKVDVRLRGTNLGVDANVIDGVSEILQTHERIIVLEDDLETSPWFLTYINDALEFYKDEDHVISIHGYTYPVAAELEEVFFLRGADCWGWATWKRGWDLFEHDGQKLLNQFNDTKLKNEFDFNDSYDYIKALEQQATGKTTHWDIRWYASAFLLNKLTLYPGKSLVRNIGHDASGTHCGITSVYDVSLGNEKLNVRTAVQANTKGFEAFAIFLQSIAKPARSTHPWYKKLKQLFG